MHINHIQTIIPKLEIRRTHKQSFFFVEPRCYEGALRWVEYVCVLQSLKGVLSICQKFGKLSFMLLQMWIWYHHLLVWAVEAFAFRL